jgi:very-short-patch-repair endonuclease
MKNFSKSILNYFATYNETRFRFNKKIPYTWTDDELTLDFSVFPELEREFLFPITENKPFSITIKKGQHQISLEQDIFKDLVLKKISQNFNLDYLESSIDQSEQNFANKKAFIVDDKGLAEEIERTQELDHEIFLEGIRIYNLALRQEIGKILLNIQSKKEEALQEKYNFEHKPNSSFNPFAIEQSIFDDLQKIAKKTTQGDEFLSRLKTYIQEHEFSMVMFDLHLMLLNFLQFMNSRTSFIFFNEIADESVTYPVFFIEVNIKNLGDEIIIENARDILMINTPAINSFRFENVLTTPRACLLSNATTNLTTIDQFFQAYYKNNQAICLKPNFKKVVAKGLPPIKYRMGLQLLEEDRKILDYSELITKLDTGAGKKFVDLVSNYVESNVENTTEEVHREFKQTYPKKSVKNIINDIPLRVNDSQKRILLAAKNPKNKVIKVEGPPGTGKSYTICALVYLANLINKSVLITSHKTQALDVVEKMLTDQFKSLHPKAKPSLLRLTKHTSLGATSNNFQSTLASASINAASERALNFNQEAVASDKQRLYDEIEQEYLDYCEKSEDYYVLLQKSFELVQREMALFGEDLLINKLPLDIDLHPLIGSQEKFSNFNLKSQISWGQFFQLFSEREKIESYIENCERLNKLQDQDMAENVPSNVREDDIDSLKSITESLLEYCNPDKSLSQFDFDAVDIIDLELTDPGFKISFTDANNAIELLQKLIQANKGIFSKIFKHSEKEEIEDTIKKDFPQILNALQERSPKEVHEDLKRVVDLANRYQDKYPFIKKDYFLVGHEVTSLNELKENFKALSSLKFDLLLNRIADLSAKQVPQLTLGVIHRYCIKFQSFLDYQSIKADVDDLLSLFNLGESQLHKLFNALQEVRQIINLFDTDFILLTDVFLDYYSQALSRLGINTEDINGLSKLSRKDKDVEKFWKFVELHQEVSHHQLLSPPDQNKIAQFEEKVHKLLEHQNDQRFKNFNNYSGDVQRAITAFNTGKRLNSEQAHMLFDNLSCIISPPNLISEYFPMEKDMVDILIIDEASQVSIAESISLMLRAKQTIVFGDELQYGAVSAQNVSKKYSMRFFKDILDDYEKDKNEVISEQEKERLASEVSEDVPEDELMSSPVYTVDPNQKEWLKTFGIRTSTLSFANAMANYKTSLDVHFRSFPEIISYSREKFYRENQINLTVNRIRTKPISQVLRFIKVESQGFAGKNINLDEINAVKEDLVKLLDQGFKGTIGIICSFREQANRMEAILRESLADYYRLVREQNLQIWFVGDVQGIERDLIYYSFVEDKDQGNGSLKYIYPVVGGRADDINNLQKQRLNVGFSRAKDTMVFVHSMPLGKYSDTSLGEALNHYQHIAQTTQDNFVEDLDIFDSPAEKNLYRLITQTKFYEDNRDHLRLIPQFNIGKYINDQYHKYIPNYRVDFLLTLSEGGREKSLIIEYDGVEYHYNNPEMVTKHNYDREYIEYDIQRQLELEQYGYSFLRINKFNLTPETKDQTQVDILNQMLSRSFQSE